MSCEAAPSRPSEVGDEESDGLWGEGGLSRSIFMVLPGAGSGELAGPELAMRFDASGWTARV